MLSTSSFVWVLTSFSSQRNRPESVEFFSQEETRMPRFNFDLAGSQRVSDQKGMVFCDCSVAGRFAEQLAADIGTVRPELCGRASIVMTDEHRNSITYCVAVPPSVARH
jgi:hypothetical protein